MTQDVFAVAAATGERGDVRFGQVGDISGRFVALVKGVGKEDYDPSRHERRNTEIHFRLDPLVESGLTNFDERDILVESNVWTKTVWPSIKALVKDANSWRNELINQFVKYELVPVRKYTRRDGSEGFETTFKFHAIYADEAACVAAYRDESGISGDVHTGQEDDDNGAGAVDMSPGVGDPEINPEKEAATMFLPHVIKPGMTEEEAAAALKLYPMVGKFYPIDSLEVQVMRGAA